MFNQNEILNSYILQHGYLIIQNQLRIPVQVIESKFSFGYISILVKPLIAGEGQLWLRVKRFVNGKWVDVQSRNKPQFELKNIPIVSSPKKITPILFDEKETA